MGKFGIKAMLHSVLSRVTEGRVPYIVPHCYSLGKILVEPERTGDYPRYLRHLKSMRHSRAVMISRRRKKYLRFIHKSAEGL